MTDNGKILVSRKLVIVLGIAAVWYMRKDRYRKGYDKGYAAGRKSITDTIFKDDQEDTFQFNVDEGSFVVSEIKKKAKKPLIEVDKSEADEKSNGPAVSYRSYYKTEETNEE